MSNIDLGDLPVGTPPTPEEEAQIRLALGLGDLATANSVSISSQVSGLGTGVSSALAVSVGSVGAFATIGGALGTPSSGTLTNATGLPIVGGTTGILHLARGGTGATTASAARTNLGLGTGDSPQLGGITIGSTAPSAGPISLIGGNYAYINGGYNGMQLAVNGAIQLTLVNGLLVGTPGFLLGRSGDAFGGIWVSKVFADTLQYTANTFATESTTARTLTSDDHGKTILCTNASATTITVPSGLPAFFWCAVVQIGTGTVTLSDNAGATDLFTAGSLATSARYAAMTIANYGNTDEYLVQ